MQAFLIACFLMALFLLLRIYARHRQWNLLLPYFAVIALAGGFLGVGLVPVSSLADAFSAPADPAEFFLQTGITFIAGIAGVLLYAAIAFILKLQRSEETNPYERFLKLGPLKFLLFLGLYLPVLALLEELIFRVAFIGLGISSGDSGMKELALVVCSSLTFGLAHFTRERPGQSVHAAIAGLVWGGAFAMTGTVWVPLAAHTVHNIVMVSLLYINYRRSGQSG